MTLAQMMPEWLTQERLIAAVVVLGVLVVIQRVRRVLRRRRPPQLNPKLAKYGVDNEAQLAADQEASSKIIATSSTASVAGYRIIRQIEAVFVDGRRTPGEAVTALKAAASRLGANAVVNLSQARTAAGKCTAQGDAVIVQVDAKP